MARTNSTTKRARTASAKTAKRRTTRTTADPAYASVSNLPETAAEPIDYGEVVWAATEGVRRGAAPRAEAPRVRVKRFAAVLAPGSADAAESWW